MSHNPNTDAASLPSEILEEMIQDFYDKFVDDDIKDEIKYPRTSYTNFVGTGEKTDMIGWLQSSIAKTYAAGVKAGLMEAMEEAPSRRGDGSIGDELHYEMWNSYRSEFLSRLEERLNDGVQE